MLSYTLNDGNGLSLLIGPKGTKGWRFCYRFANKPKLISFGTYDTVSLAEARKKRDEARSMLANGINPNDARRADKLSLLFSTENTFEAVAREWHTTKLTTWSEGYAKEVIHYLEKEIFPFLGKRPIDQITPLELLAVLQKIEKR